MSDSKNNGSQNKEMTLFCDGASRGNPGPASYGFVLYENGRLIEEGAKTIGLATNNVAEYQGLIKGLEKGIELKAQTIHIRTDSELMVKQLEGAYKVRSPHLLPLFKQAKQLLQKFAKVEIQHVPRNQNKQADALANRALDEGLYS